MKLYTLGFTGKSAEQFFTAIRSRAHIQRVLDVRLGNTSQLAGFTKRDDLRYFLRELCAVDYFHLPELAPTKALLDAYKKQGGSWDAYADAFMELMATRSVEKWLSKDLIDESCLLCSEHLPHHCHRKLVAEYLEQAWQVRLHVEHLY